MRGTKIAAMAMAMALVMVAGGAAADTKVVQEVHTGGVMGQAASDETNTIWIAEDRMRTDSKSMSFIVRYDLKKMYMANHEQKVYHEIDLPVDMEALLPPEMAGMMSAMNFEATVTPKDETKTVGKWTAKRYDIQMTSKMLQMQQTVWATKDVEFDYAAAKRMVDQMKAMQPGMASALKELSKIDGFQIEMQGTMSVMGNEVTMSQKTVSVEKSGPPEGGYEAPAGYAKEPFNPMKMGR